MSFDGMDYRLMNEVAKHAPKDYEEENLLQKEQTRFWDAVDSEYWFCICFHTIDQKEKLFKKYEKFIIETLAI